jgi:hypothetical protein
MQTNETQPVFSFEKCRKDMTAPVLVLAPTLDRDVIERAAQALFKFVFSRSAHVDAERLWMNCDEATKEGFRGEARAVIETVWPLLFRAS